MCLYLSIYLSTYLYYINICIYNHVCVHTYTHTDEQASVPPSVHRTSVHLKTWSKRILANVYDVNKCVYTDIYGDAFEHTEF